MRKLIGRFKADSLRLHRKRVIGSKVLVSFRLNPVRTRVGCKSSTARISRPRDHPPLDAPLPHGSTELHPPSHQDLFAGMKTRRSHCNAAFHKARPPRGCQFRVTPRRAFAGSLPRWFSLQRRISAPFALWLRRRPTPLPPQRPTALAPGQGAPMLPDQTPPQPNDSTNMAPAAPPHAADEPIKPGLINEGPGTLLKLPSASHARVHECAVEWQNMKTTGTAVEKTWFNFALKCLTR